MGARYVLAPQFFSGWPTLCGFVFAKDGALLGCPPYQECSDKDCSLLAHPDPPRDRPSLLIADWPPCQLEGQLNLAVMVALVPEHVLQQQDRVVIVKVHVPACLHPAL